MRNRILGALGYAEDPELSKRALDLTLDKTFDLFVELGADNSRFRARHNGNAAVPLAIVKQA